MPPAAVAGDDPGIGCPHGPPPELVPLGPSHHNHGCSTSQPSGELCKTSRPSVACNRLVVTCRNAKPARPTSVTSPRLRGLRGGLVGLVVLFVGLPTEIHRLVLWVQFRGDRLVDVSGRTGQRVPLGSCHRGQYVPAQCLGDSPTRPSDDFDVPFPDFDTCAALRALQRPLRRSWGQ
jgi:hypothetical protein